MSSLDIYLGRPGSQTSSKNLPFEGNANSYIFDQGFRLCDSNSGMLWFLVFFHKPSYSIDFSAKSHHSTTVYFPSLLSPYYNRVSPNFHIKFFFPMFGMVRTQADPSLGPLRSRHDLDNSRKSNHF